MIKEFYDSYAFDWADALSFWIVSFVMIWLPSSLGIWFWGGAASIGGGKLSIQAYFNGERGELRTSLKNKWSYIYSKFCSDRPVEFYMCHKLQLKEDRKLYFVDGRFKEREDKNVDSHGDWFLHKLCNSHKIISCIAIRFYI
jgi:hypothetical protein